MCPLGGDFPLPSHASLIAADSLNTIERRLTITVSSPLDFLQTITAATTTGEEIAPTAPFERDLAKSRALQWTDLHTGKALSLDWDGASHSGTIQVMRLDEFVSRYAEHPEAKAAGADERPATSTTRGVLGRLELCSGEPSRIGKEVDRLDEDDGDTLIRRFAVQYSHESEKVLDEACATLLTMPRRELAELLGVSERRLSDVLKGKAKPRSALRSSLIHKASTNPTVTMNRPRSKS